MVMMSSVGRELGANQASDADVADGVQGHEERSAGQHHGGEDPWPVGRAAQLVVKAPEVDQKTGGVDDRQARDHHQPRAMLVQCGRHLPG